MVGTPSGADKWSHDCRSRNHTFADQMAISSVMQRKSLGEQNSRRQFSPTHQPTRPFEPQPGSVPFLYHTYPLSHIPHWSTAFFPRPWAMHPLPSPKLSSSTSGRTTSIRESRAINTIAFVIVHWPLRSRWSKDCFSLFDLNAFQGHPEFVPRYVTSVLIYARWVIKDTVLFQR